MGSARNPGRDDDGCADHSPTLLEAAARFRERTGGVDLPIPEGDDMATPDFEA